MSPEAQRLEDRLKAMTLAHETGTADYALTLVAYQAALRRLPWPREQQWSNDSNVHRPS